MPPSSAANGALAAKRCSSESASTATEAALSGTLFCHRDPRVALRRGGLELRRARRAPSSLSSCATGGGEIAFKRGETRFERVRLGRRRCIRRRRRGLGGGNRLGGVGARFVERGLRVAGRRFERADATAERVERASLGRAGDARLSATICLSSVDAAADARSADFSTAASRPRASSSAPARGNPTSHAASRASAAPRMAPPKPRTAG